MMEGAFYQQKRTSPTALTVVVLMHGAALTALALAKTDNPVREIFKPTKVIFIEPKKLPPEVPPDPVKPPVQPQPQQQQTVLTPPKPVFQLPTQGPAVPWTPVPTPTVVVPQPGPIFVPKLDPPAPVTIAKDIKPARARANLASYVSDADYPTTAVRNEEQGTTRFRLTVGPDGKVQQCSVTRSSGSSALDSTTCRLMKQRAKFSPATGTDGKPTGDTVASSIRWVLPTD